MNKKNLTKKQLNKKLEAQHKKFMAKFKKMRARGAAKAQKQDEVKVIWTREAERIRCDQVRRAENEIPYWR